jgi:hypothetical protein
MGRDQRSRPLHKPFASAGVLCELVRLVTWAQVSAAEKVESLPNSICVTSREKELKRCQTSTPKLYNTQYSPVRARPMVITAWNGGTGGHNLQLSMKKMACSDELPGFCWLAAAFCASNSNPWEACGMAVTRGSLPDLLILLISESRFRSLL